MNGRYTPPPVYPSIRDYVSVVTKTDENVSVSNTNISRDVSIPKVEGYDLIGIIGYDCDNVNVRFYKMSYTIGSEDTDQINYAVRATSSGTANTTFYLMYFKTT